MSGVALDFKGSGGSTGAMLPHPVRPARPGWRPTFGGVVLGLLVPVLLAAAAPAPAEPEVRANLAYAGTANPRQTLDLYLPRERPAGARWPVIVYFHGGGWVGGSKAAGKATLRPWVTEGGYAGAAVNYAVYALVLHMLGYTGLIAPLAVAAGSIAGLGVNFTAARHLVFAPRR